MDGPRVTIEHDICNAFLGYDIAERVRPGVLGPVKPDELSTAMPKSGIAGVEGNAPRRGARRPQHFCKLRKVRPMGSLQEEKTACVCPERDGFLDCTHRATFPDADTGRNYPLVFPTPSTVLTTMAAK